MSRWVDPLRMPPEPCEVVGVLPGTQQAQATADSYTYGAATEALETGQAMAAWADLQAKQNVARVSAGKLGPMTCPNGFLISLPNAQGLQTCVNQRNVHIALRYRDECDSSKSQSDYSSLWFVCSILPRWFELHHPVALGRKGDTLDLGPSSVTEARKMLPTALGELGLLAPGRWGDVRSEIHALVRYMFLHADNFDRTEQSVEDTLVNAIAPVYDAAAARGGDVPAFVVQQIGFNDAGGGGLLGWLLLGGLGAAGLYVASPAAARRAMSAAAGVASSAARKVKGAL